MGHPLILNKHYVKLTALELYNSDRTVVVIFIDKLEFVNCPLPYSHSSPRFYEGVEVHVVLP